MKLSVSWEILTISLVTSLLCLLSLLPRICLFNFLLQFITFYFYFLSLFLFIYLFIYFVYTVRDKKRKSCSEENFIFIYLFIYLFINYQFYKMQTNVMPLLGQCYAASKKLVWWFRTQYYKYFYIKIVASKIGPFAKSVLLFQMP